MNINIGFRRQVLGDILALALVGTLLVAIHFGISKDLQAALAFDHSQLAVHTFLSSAYVHASNSHLYNNLVGYAIVAGFAYYICYGLDRQRWFRITFLSCLLVLPVLVNLTSYVAFQSLNATPTNSRGFSGVVAGFTGFLLVVTAQYVDQWYSSQAATNVGLGIFLALTAEVLLIYSATISLLEAGLFAVGFGLTLGSLGYYGVKREWNEGDRRELLRDSVFVATLVVVLLVLVWMMFPSDPVTEGSTTNIIAHAVGLLFGAVLSIISLRL